METCESRRKVLVAAQALAEAYLKQRSKFSRRDSTDAQPFACLVSREHQKKSYRGLAALLNDVPQRWQAETVNSMLNRNLSSACRSRSALGRKRDLLNRAVAGNLMIVANLRGSRPSMCI
jgi:hypothetical protein